ncbi:DotU family type VI secretion system protein [Ramlibacter sp. AW1]|uniref:DotU family type VI secretion system protein n=1 Tax=Ramlibacter aurantiacus TaxID=2801330 RepID=A0A936ZLS3_9BURK|nr:DotU family type VI secretion system protein [Ramlibacter aurantiacus]
MSQGNDDPFASFERTVIKPRAGRGARPDAPGTPAPAPRAPAAAPPELDEAFGRDVSSNPLVAAASPLLSAYTRIRVTAQHPDPRELQATLATAVRRFEADARRAGVPNEQVIAGRYVLCTMLDEAASGTPWGGSGSWASHSLLVAFHNETWGGEKFFQLLDRVLQNPPPNRPLLELMAIALYLGFEGRYRVQANGASQLEGIRERVAQVLQEPDARGDRELSPHWSGERRADARIRDGVPVWVAAAVTAGVLAGVFLGLRIGINTETDPTFQALQAIDIRKPAAPALPPPPAVVAQPAPAPPRLASFLKPEIDAGQVEVRDHPDRSVVTIQGDGLFEPGSAELARRVQPLIGRIGQALGNVPGTVLVTGHTDSLPIRSLRYPSNWHLSRDRAEAVRTLLAKTVQPERLRAEGRADTEPLEANNSPAGRSRNRRVEIILHAAATP